ncbi:MAG TPA: GAF domain-containing protein, partial [Polyangiaceae bacterium]|nr:GAF domain-containing protein [Polyangiaceae bacterium]
MKIPARYEGAQQLGQGGGGAVYAVTDRITGARLAFKVLAEGAGEAESRALVREAVALSALDGLGLPRIIGFGALASGERYMVRELAPGDALDAVLATPERAWLAPLADATDQLTLLHRSGLLHGDVKPANIVVSAEGRATLVDLGLAAPLREGGPARGLTPKYAAPEVLAGEAVGVRAEVYALGATLQEGLDERGDELERDVYAALTRVAKRATEGEPEDRYPSADELGTALRRAAGLGQGALTGALGWQVLGLEALGASLEKRVVSMQEGGALALEGPLGSGRSTLLRRLAFSLGLQGVPAAVVEAPQTGLSALEALRLATAGAAPGRLVLCVDDLAALPADALAALRALTAEGARLVAVATEEELRAVAKGPSARFEMPELEPRAAEELARRVIVSLPDSLVAHLVERAGGNPGALRDLLHKLGREALVSAFDVDAALAKHDAALESTRADSKSLELVAEAEAAADRGRFDVAVDVLSGLTAAGPDERFRVACVRARVDLAKGDPRAAAKELDAVAQLGDAAGARVWTLLRARTAMRLGEFARALELTEPITRGRLEDAVASEALAVRGVALAYSGEDARARQTLESAVMVANLAQDARALGIAKGSLGVAHQRAGRPADARRAYEEALAAAELANDAWGVATARLNLSGLAQGEGDLGRAILHLEAATDLGQRAGGALASRQAALNLANLDLYLGRVGRARATIEALDADKEDLPPAARAQLLGLHADLAQREPGESPDRERARELYEACAAAYDALGRPHDAAEARLEGLLVAMREPHPDPAAVLRELEALRGAGELGFGEHEALASIVKATCLTAAGDEVAAKAALDDAYERARADGKREFACRALEARGELAASQGSTATARRDTEAALAMLEEVAAKLPRDLREVFWDAPRRRALRAAVATTLTTAAGRSSHSSHSSPPSLSRTTRAAGGSGLPDSDRLTRIFEITRDLAREKELGPLLERVVDHAIALVGAERGFVLLVDEDGKLVAQTVRGQRAEDGHARFSRSVAEKVLAEGEPVIAASARDDERLAQAVSVHQLMIQSIACVPIRGPQLAQAAIGALYLETRLRPGLRFREELPTLSAFADQAAIAIENARLIEENRRRANELAIANEELQRARVRLEESLGRRTEQLAATRRDLKLVRAELKSHFGYAGIVGTSAPMRKLYAILERVKDTDVPVLVTGESGTGKEVVARAIHQ